jgi:hypothetical protein
MYLIFNQSGFDCFADPLARSYCKGAFGLTVLESLCTHFQLLNESNECRTEHRGIEYVFRYKVSDDDDNVDDSLHGWNIKF